MNVDPWAPLDDSERDRWGYAPRRTVGPLSFGMERADAVAVMAGCGFTAEQRDIGAWQATHRSQWRVAFGKEGLRWSRWPAVTCYFVEGAGLTCVLVDGLTGPQVTHEGIRLIGRVPSELSAEMEAFAIERDVRILACLGGDLSCEGFELELGAQRAGDAVVSWALFFDTGEIAGTSWDIAPAEVWHHF
ncbi:hypothetical protein [Kitasatospora sp. NPDC093679]|uniref:hypothetical protein n=1 Tax=Kitasatospora sp. NPDC093679 TaxID=3154983 RepID=UPI003427C28E